MQLPVDQELRDVCKAIVSSLDKRPKSVPWRLIFDSEDPSKAHLRALGLATSRDSVDGISKFWGGQRIGSDYEFRCKVKEPYRVALAEEAVRAIAVGEVTEVPVRYLPHSPEQVGKNFLDHFLTAQGIEPDRFYGLVRRLEEVEILDDVTPELEGTILRLRATYTGEEQIGRSREPGWQWTGKILCSVQDAVIGIYRDLSERTGIEFHGPNASLKKPECYATVLFADDAQVTDKKTYGKLEVILTQ